MEVNPNTTITINCTVWNPSQLANLLHWTIPVYGISISHVNAQSLNTISDSTHSNFVSTVIESNTSSYTASLQFPALSALDGAVVICNDVTQTSQNCTLYVKSKFVYQIRITKIYLIL